MNINPSKYSQFVNIHKLVESKKTEISNPMFKQLIKWEFMATSVDKTK